MKDNTLITITRQYGSGGREVATILAKKLGIKCYDRKIVQLAAENIDEDFQYDDLIKQSYNIPENLGDFAFENVPYYNKMYIEQAKAILKIANQGSAVFIGRCSDVILEDKPNRYSFFIYADDDFRVARAKTHYGDNDLKALDEEDKHREKYYSYYTGKTWGDPQNYDLMINTSKGTLDEAADLIIKYIEMRQK